VKAALQEMPARPASTRRHATNVKYALSTFLQDRRTERDVSRAPTLTFPPVSHRRLAQVT